MPRSMAFCIIFSAIGPWPWPSEMALNFFPNFISSAKLSSIAKGSAPAESTKTRGCTLFESLKHVGRCSGGASMKRWPKLAVTKSCMPSTTLSGRTQRSTQSAWNRLSFSLH